MEVRELLPIGSIVLLNKGTKKLMIVGIKQTNDESKKEYDYAGFLYPEGMIGELGQFLFDHADISKVFFRGYEDEEREKFISRLEQFYANQQD